MAPFKHNPSVLPWQQADLDLHVFSGRCDNGCRLFDRCLEYSYVTVECDTKHGDPHSFLQVLKFQPWAIVIDLGPQDDARMGF